AGHVRVRRETKARSWALVVAIIATTATLVAFAVRVGRDQPRVLAGGAVVLMVCFGAEALMRRRRVLHADTSI
ncbi:MAG: hypothetical protein WB239_06540, partial [Acidimicrobiia bacterium]